MSTATLRAFFLGEEITELVREASEHCLAGDWERAGAVYAAHFGPAMLTPEWFVEHAEFLFATLLPTPRSEDDVIAFRRGVERRCAAN